MGNLEYWFHHWRRREISERERERERVKRQEEEDGRRYLSNAEGKRVVTGGCALTCHVTSSSVYYYHYLNFKFDNRYKQIMLPLIIVCVTNKNYLMQEDTIN